MCLGEHEKSVLLLRYLRTFRSAFWLLLSVNLVKFVILALFALFAIFVTGVFSYQAKSVVTFAIFATFADISRPFLASSFF